MLSGTAVFLFSISGRKCLGGPALPDHETFPYEWLGVRQNISMPCFMSVIGKHFKSCREYLKECHRINKTQFVEIPEHTKTPEHTDNR